MGVNYELQLNSRALTPALCSTVEICPLYMLTVMNPAARLICGVGKFDRIQHLISDRLHWLPVHKNVQFKDDRQRFCTF